MATPADYTSAGFQEAVAAIVEQKTYNWIFDINASFLLTSGYLVFMMQLGFALVSACYCLLAVESVLSLLAVSRLYILLYHIWAYAQCLQASYGVFAKLLNRESTVFALMQLTIGAVQAKSVKSVCLKNLMDVCAGGVGYFLFGYAFAYGDPQSCNSAGVCSSTGNPFIGSKMFALHDLSEDSYQTYYFQFVVRIDIYNVL